MSQPSRSRVTRRVRLQLPVTLTVAAMALAACGSEVAETSEQDGAGADEASAGEPTVGGQLVYLEYQPHTTLYPPQTGFYPNSGIMVNLADRLTYQDPETLEIHPWVATDWEVNDDATEYVFTLREDVTFSDGTALDAEVVAKNFDTYGLGDTDRGLTISESVNNYAGSEVLGEYEVRFIFDAPSPGFLQATSTYTSGLLSAETLEGDLEDFGAGNATGVIGSGPFVITEEDQGTRLLLEAREDYDWAPEVRDHSGRAYLDSIEILVTPEDSVRIGSLTSGQADYIRYVQAHDEGQVTEAGYELFAPGTRSVNNGLAFRVGNPLVEDERVRRAIILAADTEQIVETVYSENYPVATGILTQEASGYIDLADELLVHDPDEAARLLDEAGWDEIGADGIRVRDGERLSLRVWPARPQPLSRPNLELLAQQLNAVGIELDVLSGDQAQENIEIRDPQLTPLYHGMVGRADHDVIKSFFHPENRDQLLTEDEELIALLERVSSEPDAESRDEASADVQRYLVENSLYLPIFEEPQVFGAAPHVHGIGFDPVARPDFYETWLDR